MPSDDAVTGHSLLRHTEIEAAMFDEFVELFEGILVEQELDTPPRRHLAFGLHLLLNDRYFLPVFQQLLHTLVGEVVFQHHFEALRQRRADDHAQQARLYDVRRAADRDHDNFGLEIIVAEDADNFFDQTHPILTDIVKTANER